MRELPVWVRWLLVGRFVNALGSMAWVFVPLYLVSDRGLDEAAAGSVAAVWGVGTIIGNLLGGSVGDRWRAAPDPRRGVARLRPRLCGRAAHADRGPGRRAVRHGRPRRHRSPGLVRPRHQRPAHRGPPTGERLDAFGQQCGHRARATARRPARRPPLRRGLRHRRRRQPADARRRPARGAGPRPRCRQARRTDPGPHGAQGRPALRPAAAHGGRRGHGLPLRLLRRPVAARRARRRALGLRHDDLAQLRADRAVRALAGAPVASAQPRTPHRRAGSSSSASAGWSSRRLPPSRPCWPPSLS